MLMLTGGALFLADSVLGGLALHLFHGSLWWVLLGAFIAYLSHDSGLLVLRGRSLGTFMGSVFGFALIAVGALQFAGVLGDGTEGIAVTASAVTLLGAAIIVLLFLPPTRAYFAESQRIRMAGSTPSTDYSKIDLGDAKPGSWDAIKAAEEQTGR